MIKRKGGEYKMGTIEGVSIKCGSVNRREPQVVYVTGKTWVMPVGEVDFASSISLVKRNMERRLKQVINAYDDFENRYIFDFSLTPMNMQVGKPKFMQFHIFLRQNRKDIKEMKKVKSVLDDTMIPIVRAMINDFNDNEFNLSEHKK